MTEKQIQRVQLKIKKLRAQLAAEKREWGGYHDGSGVRYIIPELYFKIKDYKGAMRYFNWFAKNFDDDGGYPAFFLMWTITLFENKKEKLAIKKAYEMAFCNLFFIDALLGNHIEDTGVKKYSSISTLAFATESAEVCEDLISPDFKNWLLAVYNSPEFQENISKYKKFESLLENEDVYEKRRKIVEERSAFAVSLCK